MFPEFPDLPPLPAVSPESGQEQLPWGKGDISPDAEDLEKSFADNFADKLPDSAEYLSILESKLEKVTKKKGDIVSDLARRRDDEMRRYLSAKGSVVDNIVGQSLPDPNQPLDDDTKSSSGGITGKIMR